MMQQLRQYNINLATCMPRLPRYDYSLLQDKTELIHLIDQLLVDLLKETRRLPRCPSEFDCIQVPTISVLDYLRRIGRYSHCSTCVFVTALVLIDRYQERKQDFIINDHNIHRLLICCIMVAAKYCDDFYYRNDFYAKVGGIPSEEMNQLELNLLLAFDFSVFIREDEFSNYLRRLEYFREINEEQEE